MAEPSLEINSKVRPDQADDKRGAVHEKLPADLEAWIAQAPADLIARWRMEVAAGLRDGNGRLTCASLHNPNAPISEAHRISDALMEPAVQNWLAKPVRELLREWGFRP